MKSANSDPQSILELGWVTDVQTHSESTDYANYTCDVTLRDTRQTLYKVPLATDFIGFTAPPALGDLVLVLYQRGGIHSPFVIGRVYSENPRQPITKMGELRLIVGDRQIYFSDDGALTIHRSENDEQAFIRIDPDNLITIYSENDISLNSQTRIRMEAPEIKITASEEVDISASRSVGIISPFTTLTGLFTNITGYFSINVTGMLATLAGWEETIVQAWRGDLKMETGFPKPLDKLMPGGGGDIKVESNKNIMLESPENLFFVGDGGINLASDEFITASGGRAVDISASDSIGLTSKKKIGISANSECVLSGGSGKELLNASGVKIKGPSVDTNFAGSIPAGYQASPIDTLEMRLDMKAASALHNKCMGWKTKAAKFLVTKFVMFQSIVAFIVKASTHPDFFEEWRYDLPELFSTPDEWDDDRDKALPGHLTYLDNLRAFLGPGAGYYSASPPDTSTEAGKFKATLDGFLQNINTVYGLKIPDTIVFPEYERYFLVTFNRITKKNYLEDDVAITQDHVGELKDQFLEDIAFAFDISLYQTYLRDLKAASSIDFKNTILRNITDENTADTDTNLYAILEGILQEIDADDPAVTFAHSWDPRSRNPYNNQLNDHKGAMKTEVEEALKDPDQNLLYHEVDGEDVIKRGTGDVNTAAVLAALKTVITDYLDDNGIYHAPT
jgi:hypothetical protein